MVDVKKPVKPENKMKKNQTRGGEKVMSLKPWEDSGSKMQMPRFENCKTKFQENDDYKSFTREQVL